MASKGLTVDNMNPNVVTMQYAVRGPLVIRAGEIEKELQGGTNKPFKRVIRANIGDAHAMGQKPITFLRQVLACCIAPDLLEKPFFPADVKTRAKELLGGCGGKSVGSYSASQGIELIRKRVAEYIERRDGHPANWQDVCLSTGASTAIKNTLQLFVKDINGTPSGVLIPIPQYPLYSASLAEYGLGQEGYFLNEDDNWSLDIAELERAKSAAKSVVRAIVVINPGNPTGSVLSRPNIEAVIKFAHQHKLFLLADEVYQDNVYAEGSKFFSFKKVLRELGDPYSSEVQMASYMSLSKGYMGECGLRGGYMELVNLDPKVQEHLYKCISAMLCPNIPGQIIIDLVARPPQQGEPSYDLWLKEKAAVLDSLKQRAKITVDTFNSMAGFKCNVIQGAMYAFPMISLPEKAIEAAKAAGKAADVFYAFKLLEETGICIVPGSGFGQRPGTYHFRTTILPQPALLQEMLDTFKSFHEKFLKEYKGGGGGSACGAGGSMGSAGRLTVDNMNPNVVTMQYAVRGPLVIRAGEIEKELQEGASKPFKRVIRANIGDAHAMGQAPITFIRQVLACCTYPDLIQCSDYPDDVKKRATEILGGCGGKSVGSYSVSQGIELIRKRVAEYIERRDGHPANWQDICLSNGASTAIKNCLQLFVKDIDGTPSGVLIPIPQYPLYSASLAEYGLGQEGYFLNEDEAWSLDIAELERARSSAKSVVRAIVAINPGNPTGSVLTRPNIEAVIKFAHQHKLLLLADEVYQDNVYAEGSKYFSFKKVLRELGDPYSSEVQLASFMSLSKGYMGECGLRGGYMELVNLDPKVQEHLYKCISAMLCPNVLGQAAVDCVARPPQQGEPSYELWIKEKTAVLDSLKQRAKMCVDTFNSMAGFKCNVVQGAMYAFPMISLPEKAIEAAKAAGKAADVFYAFKLLEETGICIVAGSGFGQRPGTYHFRTTILPQPALLQEMLDIFKKFHEKFQNEFS